MLFNVSYDDREIERKINNEVGKAYGFIDRFKIGGIGSPKMRIISCSEEIDQLLSMDNNVNVCNIELRPKGIILRFRSLLDPYALPIPFYKLTLYKEKASEYIIYYNHHFVKVQDYQEPLHKFIQRILEKKAQYHQDTQPRND